MITRRKQLFITFYIKTKNATESAKRAGYSERTAYSQGQRLLKTVEVSAALDKAFEEIAKSNEITKDNIILKYWNEVNTAEKSSDRTNALNGLSKVLGIYRDTTIQSITFFGDIDKKVKERIPNIREVKPLQESEIEKE